jgi:general secretion pathway protein G
MSPLPSRPRRHEAAYTLFEIMLVLGIIAVLVGSAVYLLVGNVDVAKKQRVDTDIQTITTQLKTYEMVNYRFPTTDQGINALVERPTVEPIPPRWTKLMREMPLDPWGTPYKYICPGKVHPDSFDIYSLGPDHVPSEDDYPPQSK